MEKARDEAGWDRWALWWLEKKLDSVFSQVRLVIQRIYPESDTVTSALLKYGTLFQASQNYGEPWMLRVVYFYSFKDILADAAMGGILILSCSVNIFTDNHIIFMLWLLTISNSGEIFRAGWYPAL